MLLSEHLFFFYTFILDSLFPGDVKTYLDLFWKLTFPLLTADLVTPWHNDSDIRIGYLYFALLDTFMINNFGPCSLHNNTLLFMMIDTTLKMSLYDLKF